MLQGSRPNAKIRENHLHMGAGGRSTIVALAERQGHINPVSTLPGGHDAQPPEPA